MEFYIFNNNSKEGPFSITELSAKRITPDTLVWAIGYKEWKRAQDIPELNDIIYNVPPEPPVQKPMPKTWMAESILVTIFCCLPFGIVGIIYAAKVSSLYAAGKYEGAEAASKNAGKWTKIGFFVSLAVIIIYMIFYAFTFMVLLNA